MYELFSGTPPFTASSADELARLHISARPLSISEYVPDVPSALEEIIMKVLSKEPSSRYRTADQLGRVLQKFGTLPDPTPQTTTPPVITIRPEIAEKLSSPSQPIIAPPVEVAPPQPTTTYTPQTYRQPASQPETESATESIDWVSIGLGLLAVIAVGGLIPFWLLVYLTFNPPS
jgi:serine/threonine-protein kinase